MTPRAKNPAKPPAPAAARTNAQAHARGRVSVAQSLKTPIAKAAFLGQYTLTGNVSHACRLAGVGRRTVYDWLKEDAPFATRYADAETEAIDGLELEARRRAVTGTKRPIYQGGELVGHEQMYSDTLLIFLLKGKRPDVYRERTEHTGAGGGPIAIHKRVTFGGRYKPPTKGA